MGNLIVNNVTKGFREIYARGLHFNHNDNDIFDKDFQLNLLNATNLIHNEK